MSSLARLSFDEEAVHLGILCPIYILVRISASWLFLHNLLMLTLSGNKIMYPFDETENKQ